MDLQPELFWIVLAVGVKARHRQAEPAESAHLYKFPVRVGKETQIVDQRWSVPRPINRNNGRPWPASVTEIMFNKCMRKAFDFSILQPDK